MKHALVFRDEASLELEGAHNWYDERQAGLGDDFMDEVESLLDVVANTPERFPIVLGVIRRALVHRFPYAIYFRIVDDTQIRVLAIFHARRDPAIWRGRT